MIDVIGKRKLFLGIALVLVIAAIVAMVVFGFRQGIEFRGGTLWQFRVDEGSGAIPAIEEILTTQLEEKEALIKADASTNAIVVRLPELTEEEHHNAASVIRGKYDSFEELSFQSIGPSVGERLRSRSFLALVLVLLGISLYIAFAFRKVFRPISSWTYGVITLLTLAHDVIIPSGLLAVLGWWKGLELDTTLIVALLVIMGFSVHDTIVVFDRIRENLMKERDSREFGEIINKSINQIIMRSFNTSFTLVLVLIGLLVAGPASLWYFVLTLLVGIISGVYSSMFVASPLLYVSQGILGKRRK